MRIAVISDIHGNDIALKEVLVDAKRLDVTELVVLGDLVGYYYWPDKVFSLLESFGKYTSVRGNHEDMLGAALESQEKATEIRSKYGSGIDKAISKLSNHQIDYLLTLPEKLEIERGNSTIYLGHESPLPSEPYVYPDASFATLQKCALPSFDFVCFGHTHHPFCFSENNTTVVNPGSVGQPRDVGNSASYVILDTDNKTIVFRRVLFKTDSIIKACLKEDPDRNRLREILVRNAQGTNFEKA